MHPAMQTKEARLSRSSSRRRSPKNSRGQRDDAGIPKALTIPSPERASMHAAPVDVASARRWSGKKEIIDLVDNGEEDHLLDELLDGENPGRNDRYPAKKSTATPETSDTSERSTRPSPRTSVRFVVADERREEESEEDSSISGDEDDDDDKDDNESVDAYELLNKSNARMEQQRLIDEVKELRRTIEKKDEQLEQLAGQLRMAISTKCDLVLAHTELERIHESDIQQREEYASFMKRNNLALQEMRAEVEREFMNELAVLAKKMKETEERHQAQLKDKDSQIDQLADKLSALEKRAASGKSVRPMTDKVLYYRQQLGWEQQK